MKNIIRMNVLFALVGAAILLVLAVINLTVSGTHIELKMLFLPAVVGLVTGYFIGSSRQKWLDKARQLEDSTAELARNLEEVKEQKVITKNLIRMYENIPLPMYLKDENHRYLMANPQYEFLTGKTWQEINGQTDYEFFPEPIADLFREQDLEIIKYRKGKTFEETIPLPSGIITFETFKFPLLDKEGNIYAVGGVCTDITKLKKTEDSLNSQKERLDVVLQQMNEAVIATDCDGRIVMINQKAAELIELSRELCMGDNLENVYVPKDSLTGMDVAFWSEKNGRRRPLERSEHEVVLRTNKGKPKPVIQKTVILLDQFGQNMGLLVLFRGLDKLENSNQKILEHKASTERKSTTSDTALTEETIKTDKIRIMVMDDDPLIRKTCTLMLATQGYETLHANNGQEAIDLYGELLKTENPVKAIIMDLTVPGAMGGVEATTKILAIDPDARIVVASGYSNDPILANFEEYGFLARVEKPFAVKKFMQTVNDVVAR